MTAAVKGTFRPDPVSNTHVIEAGLQRDEVQAAHARVGHQRLDRRPAHRTGLALRGQHRTDPASGCRTRGPSCRTGKAIIGLRAERWTAHRRKDRECHRAVDIRSTRTGRLVAEGRDRLHRHPRLAPSRRRWVARIADPTTSELYQGSIVGGVVTLNDPNLKPERGVTSELSAERIVHNGSLRFTVLLRAHARRAVFAGPTSAWCPNVTNIQNVDLIRTNGLEFSGNYNDVFMKGLDVLGSITYADSKILANRNFPASVGHRQPRVPNWRANLLLSYHVNDQLTTSIGARYSGRQYGTLDNADPNGYTYTGLLGVHGRRRAHALQVRSTLGSVVRHRQPQQQEVLGYSIRIPSGPSWPNWGTTCDRHRQNKGAIMKFGAESDRREPARGLRGGLRPRHRGRQP